MPAEELRHSRTVGDIRPDEGDPRIVEDAGQIQQAAGVGELVYDDDGPGRADEDVTDEVRTDEAGATGDE
jgi:hypothetical protein